MIAQEKIRAGLRKLKHGLPMEAFVIVGDVDDPETWSERSTGLRKADKNLPDTLAGLIEQ